MSHTIHILPVELASKIAAGEVVQRPASVVKELLENSVDAGATSVTVVIKDGGKSFIQVVDNGRGMSEEDARIAFERYATSKISTYEDLENIRTLGFRGEALASIAAVAQVELRTRPQAEAVGTSVRIEGGAIGELAKEACDPGTSITVRNLFYNTPARRNFLRSNSTEFKYVFDVVQRIALARPDWKILFESDEDIIFDLRPSTRDERMQELFGDHQFGGLVTVDDAGELATVSGYVSKPDFSRKTRVEQFLFLNGRYIISRSLNHAVFQGYEHLLEKGSFPVFVLFLTIDPQRVDVNVHPSKMEVKFEDERSVYRHVMNAVRKTLLANDLVPSLDIARAGNALGYAQVGSVGGWEDLLRPHSPTVDTRTGEIRPARDFSPIPIPESGSPHSLPAFENSMRQARLSPSDVGEQAGPSPKDLGGQAGTPQFFTWQLHNKYIIVPSREGLMIVDQHVAHERVLYERIVERMRSGKAGSQQLMFPHNVELSAGDASLVNQLMPDLTAMGFALKFFGKGTVVVEGVPADVKPDKETTILKDLVDLYKENEHSVNLDPRENLAKSYSCKAAIKAGDSLNTEEMRSLLEHLFSTENPFVCPHGRPVIVKLSMAELDKRFGRPV